MGGGRTQQRKNITRAVDSHLYFADPDPAVSLNADPDPGRKMNADPDPQPRTPPRQIYDFLDMVVFCFNGIRFFAMSNDKKDGITIK